MPLSYRQYQRIVAFISTKHFFRIIVGLFFVQAIWIALSGRYPMAFDEDFHFGLIKLYAEHVTPFWGSQLPDVGSFGAVPRDPSYLYHWLMSFPYQLIRILTDNQTAQVLILRGINISMFASALPIYRRLLLRTGASPAVIHSCLLALVLIPITPLLAAQINYDNLWIPIVGLVLLLVTRFVDEMRLTKRINTHDLLLILSSCMLASLIKYAFLPIFAAVVLYLGVQFWRTYKNGHEFLTTLVFGATLMTRRSRWAVLIFLAVSLGLFAERYGVNLVRYHKPVADCAQVLSVEQCNQYGPWQRDNFLATHKSTDVDTNPQSFGFEWMYGMWFRLFFAVDGPTTHFETKGPLLFPALTAIIVGIIGTVTVSIMTVRVYIKRRSSPLSFLALVTLLYVAALILDGYEAYTRTGRPVALNGRYLLPVLPLIFTRFALSFHELLRPIPKARVVLLSVIIVCLAWGGGALTYIIRSTDAWYWDSNVVKHTNYTVRHTLSPVIPGSAEPRLFAR